MTKPWKEFRQEIVRLYIQEGRTLRDVQDIMRRHHNFNASIRSYRQQFDHWGVGKYKCKKRSRGHDLTVSSVKQPPSPPVTPMLPPMANPIHDQKHMVAVGPPDSASVDNDWPAPGSGNPYEREHRHGRSHSVTLPFYHSSGAVAPYVGNSPPERPYHPSRASLPMMSTLVDETASGWVNARAQFAHSDAPHREPSVLCSPRDAPSLAVAREYLPSVYQGHKAAFEDDPDWTVPRSGMYSLTGNDTPYHQDSILNSRPRTMHTDLSSTPCSLVAAKGYAASNHLPLDRINIFGRNG